MFGLEKEELNILKNLNSPIKIQEFLNKLETNFEENGDTCMSPKIVLREKKCHCMEGSILAALVLRINRESPLIVDLKANDDDYDHTIAVFKKNGKWGAISKTNHAVLRYRDPVYDSIRELVMSYFHEYFNDHGKKTLRSFSMPVDLSRFDKYGWMNSEENVWYIPEYLVNVKHYSIVDKSQILRLKKADKIEIKVGKIVEWKNKKRSEINLIKK